MIGSIEVKDEKDSSHRETKDAEYDKNPTSNPNHITKFHAKFRVSNTHRAI
jgi:hypothetical protein